MKVDSHQLEEMISAATALCQHYEETNRRAEKISSGATPLTLGAGDDVRVFAFPPSERTVAYLVNFGAANPGGIRTELKKLPLVSATECAKRAEKARAIARHHGFRKFFTSLPEGAEEAVQWFQNLHVAELTTVLDGFDAAMGWKAGRGYTGIDIQPYKLDVERDLRQRTDLPITWADASAVEEHIAASTYIANARKKEADLLAEVDQAEELVAARMADREINATDVSVLETVTEGRIRLNLLKHLTLREIASSQVKELTSIKGVGEKTANQAIAAARSYVADVEETAHAKINFRDKESCSEYVVALARLISYRDQLRGLPTEILELRPVEGGSIVRGSAGVRGGAAQGGAGVRGGAAQGGPVQEAPSVRGGPISQYGPSTQSVPIAIAGNAARLLKRPNEIVVPDFTAEDAWHLYAVRAADFHAFLDQDSDGAAGNIPQELAEKIESTELTGEIRASLRGYQAFGAKFALAQKKVLIGDEMGLGKTLQALAVLAEQYKAGNTHSLVVCPPSLRINWEREIKKFTDLRCFLLFGPDKDVAYESWQRSGGIAVAGFPEVRNNSLLTDSEIRIDSLIVDEAHRAKNPDSLQSQGVKALTDKIGQVVYLTGTPLENRLSEFETLLSYLNPKITKKFERIRRREEKFKTAIAEVYLRRNQADVLDELPELVECEEWIEPNVLDRQRYEEAVRAGHFMNMRQAFGGTDSAKMERIQELLADGADTGKTIVFTYFRSVLGNLMDVFGERAYGPIAGGVTHADRQRAVDDFTNAEPGAVLVAQITAASEGLNIQAANRVILFEPQLNPAIEAQAIARAHRMGQINVVEVHRFLTPDSVEERVFDLLAQKRDLFDRYARDSAAKDLNPEAVDISESALIKQVIAEERERIGEPESL